jgi:hypothetical protein
MVTSSWKWNDAMHFVVYLMKQPVCKTIQGVRGGKVNIPRCHSIGDSEQKKKMYKYVCRIPKCFRDKLFRCKDEQHAIPCPQASLKIALMLMGRPLLSSGQSYWLQIQRSGYDSRCYQIFLEVLGLERGPLSFVRTT